MLLFCACAKAPRPPELTQAASAPAERFCEEFRREQTRDGREARSFGWPAVLPGMTPLERRAAPSGLTAALLGPPCRGGDDLWALPVARLTGHLVGVEQEFVAVRSPSMVALQDGRTAFFAIASEGDYHAADAFGLIGIVEDRDASATPLFAMAGSGTWGQAGSFNVPRGHLAIWSSAGDLSFGDVQGWAGVTDLSAPTPREVGRFLTYGRHTCLTGDASPGSQCRGAWEYIVTSIVYAAGGELTLTWRLDTFDEQRIGGGEETRRLRQSTRSLSAIYQMAGGTYRRVSGEAPARIE
jgi:hypothetical protein